MKTKQVDTYWVRIYMAGDLHTAKHECELFCFGEGLCVTVTPTDYIYTGGREDGFIVELVNYPRFPAEPEAVWNKADRLATQLRGACCQLSSLLMDPSRTAWVDAREDCKAAAK